MSPGMRLEDDVVGTLGMGLRGYLPLLERGEGLAVSVAAGWLHSGGLDAATIEVGAYVLFGVIGLHVAVAFPDSLMPVTVSLSVRYF